MAYRRAMRARNLRFVTSLRYEGAAPALLLSPHLDDAVLDCWSLLDTPSELSIVNVFAGTPPAGSITTWDRIVGASDSTALMHARRLEDREALALVGREPIDLAFIEFQHRPYSPDPGFRALDEALAAVASSVSRIYAPMVLGTVHPDHRVLRAYALAVSRAGVPVSLYADAPYATVYGWPHWVTGAPKDPHLDVDAYWAESLEAVPGLSRPRVAVLEPERAARKLEAMQRYATQFPSLDRGPIGQLTNPSVHPHEVFWDVT